jgi:hypothetical protein
MRELISSLRHATACVYILKSRVARSGEIPRINSGLDRFESSPHRTRPSTSRGQRRSQSGDGDFAAVGCALLMLMREPTGGGWCAGQIANNQLRVHDQVMLLEGSQATAQTVQALRSGAHAMKEVQKMTNIDNVEQVRLRGVLPWDESLSERSL